MLHLLEEPLLIPRSIRIDLALCCGRDGILHRGFGLVSRGRLVSRLRLVEVVVHHPHEVLEVTSPLALIEIGHPLTRHQSWPILEAIRA